MAKKIDFAAINAAALGRFDSLVREWLPGGERSGSEYRVLNPVRHDNKKGSFSISLTKGVWMDFATDDRGSDPISLFAYLFHNNDQGAAAKDLADVLGLGGGARSVVPHSRSEKSTSKPEADSKPGNDSPWNPVIPVPTDAPERHAAHPVRGKPETVWTYRGLSGELLGYVFRFVTSDGGKEILPLTWCRHAVSGRTEWRWMQWTVPRPLYGLERLTVADVDDAHHKATVLIVEGEKCADAAAVALPELAVLTWSGGSKAVDKADWSVLAGRKVIIWPDCDSQREKLPKDSPDGFVPDYLPEDKQPGIVAARKVATGLHALGCKVWVMKTPAIGSKTNGWDVADAIAEGMTGEALEQYVRQQSVWFEGETAASVDPAKDSKPLSTPETVCTGGGGSGDVSGSQAADDDEDWRERFHQNKRGTITPCRANVGLILEHHPAWRGVLGFNEFSGEIVKIRRPPWGGELGTWENHDDAALDEWLTRGEFQLVIRALGTLAESVEHVARKNTFNPVKTHLEGLPSWDGERRLTDWLAALTDNENDDYLRLVGEFFLIGMVKRIYEPGCKFDYMIVLEGKQGLGKSTFLSILGGDWFSETPFEISTNEGNMRIQGVWLQEMPEMGMFTKAEDTAFKSFLAITRDKYRRPYDRRPIEKPRVCLFGGTTNLKQYLKDPTGNRRIWPVWCNEIDNEGLRDIREQLFAEALHLYRSGARCYPTRDEERNLFEPEQRERLIQEGWEEIVKNYLSNPETDIRLCNFFTSVDLLTKAIGMEKHKVDDRQMMRLGRIMSKIGWERRRCPSGTRPWGYIRPEEQRESSIIFPVATISVPDFGDD